MALLTVDQWAANVDGRFIDYDGIGVPIWQCHDLWIDYLIRVAGGTQYMGYAPTGYTDSVWKQFPVNGVDAVMTKHSDLSGIQKGDVVFFASGSANYPSSHVAIALAAPSGGSVYCMTQNPGPAHRETLTLAGALGYLRPKNTPTPTPTSGNGATMFMIYLNTNPVRYAVVGSKFFLEFTGEGAATNINRQLTGSTQFPSLQVSQGFWDACKAATL